MIIYTDGACSGNGSTAAQGGFAVVVMDDNENIIDTFAYHNDNTTNNQEELRAVIFAMAAYGTNKPIPVVYSDSAYVVNTFNNWMWNWESRGWLKSNNTPPENLDLIKMYYNLWKMGYRINLKKCPGHSKIAGNELADKLAKGKVRDSE